MAAINVYASVCISKLMLAAPRGVKTLGDIGDWVFGASGRAAMTVAYLLSCTMASIMFLVLGGSILVELFPSSYDDTTWIILMAASLLPLCLVPTVQESAGTATAGAIGIILADGIALYLLDTNVNAPTGVSAPPPEITLSGVTTAFGSLSLAYAAGTIIPTLQREHSQPERMPRVITVTLTIVSIFFLLVSVLGDFKVGCQIPGNLLFAITGDKLGFEASRGGIILAYLFMFIHIAIAFGLVLFPTLFFFERVLLGMHKEAARPEYNDVETPKDSATTDESDAHYDASEAYKAPGAYLKAAIVRTVIVIVCVVIAIVFKNKFSDLLDFVGASTTSTCCIILPMVFYLKQFYATLPLLEKAFAIVSIIATTALAIYVTIQTGSNLFAPADAAAVRFPYCAAEFQHYVFTNQTHYQL